MNTTRFIPLAFCLALIFSACSATAQNNSTPTPLPSPTLIPTPSSTPIPLAARVNGEGILLADYQTELQRLQAAQTELGLSLSAEEQRQKVLDYLIEEALLAQAAEKNGLTADEAAVNAEFERLAAAQGGAAALDAWIVRNGYTRESFRSALQRSLSAAAQRDAIAESVPTTAEQVHARQIMLLDLGKATLVRNNLLTGSDFLTQALYYDPVTGGDLSWFPRGYLTVPEIEEAAFALEPGQFSEVIQTRLGYHILYIEDRDPQRPLSLDARRVLQAKALQEWLKAQRANSTIEILIP
ncbi:MAG: SurA N-terminal domain-containing protein [Anaerolinea sp.]|nr:SurA N-terminal domain-containing protein [Anaerolinea sp.]